MVRPHKPLINIFGITAALIVAFGLVVAAVVPAKALDNKTCFKTSNAASLRGVTWVSDLNPAAKITFGPDGVGGNDSCNAFGGNYKVVGNILTFDRIIMTMRFCYENQATQRAFGRMFNSRNRFTVHHLFGGKRRLIVEPLGSGVGSPITFTTGIGKHPKNPNDGVER